MVCVWFVCGCVWSVHGCAWLCVVVCVVCGCVCCVWFVYMCGICDLQHSNEGLVSFRLIVLVAGHSLHYIL